MFRRTFMAMLAVAVFAAAPSASTAADPKSLEIFGARLNGATRDQLRQVLKKHGLRVLKEDKNEWFDTYGAEAALEGASELAVGYVQADTFAIAEYTLPSFMDIQQVERVVSMIATKYGRPTSVRGNFGLGQVTATWKLGPNAEIEVARGWPNTTTYLRLIDPAARNQMVREMEAARKAQTEQKAKAQSKAF
jgi:hypothetical protein